MGCDSCEYVSGKKWSGVVSNFIAFIPPRSIDHFTVCRLSILAFEWTWGWGWSCFDTNLLPFLWTLFFENTIQPYNNDIIYSRKQQGLYQNKLNSSLVLIISTCYCKWANVKFRKASGLVFFKGPFWGAFIRRGLSTEGNLRFKIDWASFIVGSKLTVFALFNYFNYIWGQISKYKPQGGLYFEGRFNGGFFALLDWGAYIWRGLYTEGLILRNSTCTRDGIRRP